MDSQGEIDGGTVECSPLNEAEHDPLIGTVFGHKYEITELLGSGGMSAVYKARQVLMDRWVAIKVLRPELVQDSLSLQRFQQESKAASMLSHPNVLSVHDFDVSEQGVPYLIMDLLQGRSVSSILTQEGHMHPARCVFLYSQACGALAHAHSKGVIHRDIKPSNLMVIVDENEVETVKLVDFGIAKLLESSGDRPRLTKTGEIFGSPYYMSPEQCSGKPLDARSDVYSLGCVIYESLVGVRPISGSSMIETVLMHVNDLPAPFKEVRPDLTNIPEALETAVLKSLAKSPDDRYKSMTEFDAALRASYRDYMAEVAASRTKPSIEAIAPTARAENNAPDQAPSKVIEKTNDERNTAPNLVSFTGQSAKTNFTCTSCLRTNPLGLLYCQYCGQPVNDLQRVSSHKRYPCRVCGSDDELNSHFCTACGNEIVITNSRLTGTKFAALLATAISILGIAGVWYWNSSHVLPPVSNTSRPQPLQPLKRIPDGQQSNDKSPAQPPIKNADLQPSLNRATEPWIKVTALKVVKKDGLKGSSLEPQPERTIFVTGDTICYRIEGLRAMPEPCHIYLLDQGSGFASLLYHSVAPLQPGGKLICPGSYSAGKFYVQTLIIGSDPGVDKLIVIASPRPISALQGASPSCSPIFERAMKLLAENPEGLLVREDELVKAGSANTSNDAPLFLKYFVTAHRPK